MAKKKQQTIEATLGRPKLKANAPKVPAPKASSDTTPKKPVSPSGDGPQSWFYTAKARDSPKSRAPPPPPSSFMPPSSSRKKVSLADSSSSADEASSLDDEDERPGAKATPPKRVTPGKGGEKRQTRLSLGSSPRSAVVVDDESSDDLPVATPRVSGRRALGKDNKPAAAAEDSDDDSDDAPIATPKASRRALARPGKRPAPTDDNDEDDDDDLPTVASLASKRRDSAKRAKRARSEDDNDEQDDDVVIHSTKRRRLARKNGAGLSSSPPPRSSPIKRHSKSNRRREKDKQRELLRRRRAGEDITLDDIETSEDEEEEHHALYDTDSDHVALEEFEDDDEGVLEPEMLPKSKEKKKGKRNKQPEEGDRTDGARDDEEVDKEMDDFIEEDEEGTLGVPADLLEMPLEFTRHSRKPLKEHFRDVIEWLVQLKFEPNFEEKQNELYMLGWKKLDDEVQALASSKFASSAWKPDFRRALNARPNFVSVELPRGDLDRLFGTCEACGRSGHPATWTILFEGAAYYRKNNSYAHFLGDVESDEESEESSDSDDDSERDAKPTPPPKKDSDEDGNELPPESRQWSVGSVCKSNAETAHTLIHWKHNLLDWVSDRLENDGYMTPVESAARTKMKRKQKNKMVDAIIAKWEGQRVIESLYRDFKGVLDEARNKSTTGRGGGRWGR